MTGFSFDLAFGNTQHLKLQLIQDRCSNSTLEPGANCTFIISIQGNQPLQRTLTPKVCAYSGAICSVPTASQRVQVIVSDNRTLATTFPLPYAGTFYPIYNSGPGQWLAPDKAPIPPFDAVSALFVAFAHAYPDGNGAIFTYEAGQSEEPMRLRELSRAARIANPHIKIIMSLGWGKNDWTYINNDYVNHANKFVPSVIAFIRTNHLDGIDIDDESIGEDSLTSSGHISQTNFDGVIANLRNALNYAALQDGKSYYLTITPAGNNQEGGLVNTQVDGQNAASFNLINIQSYYNGSETFGEDFFNALLSIGYPQTQMANGIDSQESCDPTYPPYIGLAGIFNWNMTADSICQNYSNTMTIANLVGY